MRVLRPAVLREVPVDMEADVGLKMEAADAHAIEEVNLAYENVKEVDCLDISREGNDLWDAAVQRYADRIDRVEARITAHLRDQLGNHCFWFIIYLPA